MVEATRIVGFKMMQQPDPRFVQSLCAGLFHWQARTSHMDEQTIHEVDAERQNLYRIVQYGLVLPETWKDTVSLALQTFDLIERRGYWEEWGDVLQSLLSKCPEHELFLQCKLLNRLGQLQRLSRQLSQAIETHQQSYKIAQALGNLKTLAEIHHHLLEDYLANRQYAEAEYHGQTAWIMFVELKEVEQKWIAGTLKMLGVVAGDQGDLQTAEERLSQATTIWRALDNPTALARSLSDLANTLWAAGKYAQALNCFDEAATLLTPTINEFDKAMIHINRGTLYFRQENWGQAEAAFRQADSSYLRQSGHIYYQAVVANNLGNVLLKQTCLSEAESHLRNALRLWIQANDDVSRGNTLGTLGELLTLRRQLTEAIACYDEAIAILTNYPHNAWARTLLTKFQEQSEKIKP